MRLSAVCITRSNRFLSLDYEGEHEHDGSWTVTGLDPSTSSETTSCVWLLGQAFNANNNTALGQLMNTGGCNGWSLRTLMCRRTVLRGGIHYINVYMHDSSLSFRQEKHLVSAEW